jgi:hypothetical protein
MDEPGRFLRAEETRDAAAAADFLRGGEMGALMRSHDRAAIPLGSPATWPQSLRSAVSICLGSSFPICIYGGRELVLLYNDAWSPIPGSKHPWALGRPRLLEGVPCEAEAPPGPELY